MNTDKKASIEVILNFYDWHTKLFKNVLVEISDNDATNRLGTKANHIAWIAGSMVSERYQLATYAGKPMKQTSGTLFENHKGIQEGVDYPSLEEYKKDWEEITPVLREALSNLSNEQLNGPDPYGMGPGMTFYDAIMGCTDRESYCIGQIALYRRLLGYDAMKYN
jgi:hypothetical protein